MMGNYFYGGNMMATFGFFWFITWIALLTFLILGSIFFWKEITKSNNQK